MKIGKALNLLKQQLDEISKLRTLPPERQQYEVWRGKVCNILELTFGKTSREYDKFARAVCVDYPTYTDEEKRKKYNKELDAYEIALKSAIHKCELLEDEGKPSEVSKTPEDYEEKVKSKESEIILHGTPDMILKCIQDIAERPNSQGYNYSFRRTSGAPDYAKWDKTYFASCAISQDGEGQIGTIKLQLLPKEKTSVKYSEPEKWDSSFGYFLNSLFAEFQKLEFVDLEKEKPITKTEPQKIARRHKLWRWAKNNKLWSILIVGIPVLAALIYVIDYFWKLFSK